MAKSRSCYNRLMAARLLLIPWITGIAYASIPLFWFAIHPFASRWQQMRRSPYRVLLPLWMAIIAILGLVTWPWHSVQLYSNPFSWIPAIVFAIVSLIVYTRIRREFGVSNFIGETELRPSEHRQTLIRAGMHARMRHPIYFAHLCMLAGLAIGSGLAVTLILLAISALCTFPLMIWLEERELEKRFGQRYREYKQDVPILPIHKPESGRTHVI